MSGKSVKDIASELGLSMKANRDALRAQAATEAAERAEQERQARDRAAAFDKLCDDGKAALTEAKDVLMPFAENQFAIRVDDARKDISTRASDPLGMSNRHFQWNQLPGKRVIEFFVCLIWQGNWEIGFARDIVNYDAIMSNRGGRNRSIVAPEHGDNIIAFLHNERTGERTVFDDSDPLKAISIQNWASVQVSRMLTKLK